MVIVIALIAVLVIGAPTGVWFAVGAARANRARSERAPAARYNADDDSGRRQPNVLGKAWARTTTFIE